MFVAGLCGQLCKQRNAEAAPALRFLVDEHGDMVLFGNSAAFDCRAGIPAPVVGTVGMCGGNTTDSAPDVLWRSDDVAGSALADTSISVPNSRTSAVFRLPAGATVLYARLYWASQVDIAATPNPTVTFERPGGFSRVVTADSNRGTAMVDNGLRYYQSTADVTADVQANGPGVYRVGAIDTLSLTDLNQSVDFVAWTVVVFYRLNSEPTRNLALFDGLDRVASGAPADATLSGFLVPTAGFDAKLGAISYEGDYDLTGDALTFNGTAVSDGINPAGNFFNGTRSYLGAAVSTAGELPQLSGASGSMSSFDMDIINITSLVKAGDTQATINANSSGDVYFLGAFVTSIATLKPVFSDTNKTFSNLSRVGNRILPGDVVEYTITTRNTGSDTGINVVVTDPLLPGVTYVPGSLVIATGDNVGSKTDAAGDDQAEYIAATNTIVVRIGASANATTGGIVKVNDPVTTIRFRVTVRSDATGVLNNQATVSSQGQIAVAQGLTSTGSWLSGDGANPNVPTRFQIDGCVLDANCPVTRPICDTTAMPTRCICRVNSDCQPGYICDTAGSASCVQCTAGNTSQCSATSTGAACLANNTCGCNNNTDCAGRTCNLTTHQCPSQIYTDLAVLVMPPAAPVAAGGTAVYTVTLVNNGPGAIANASIADTLPAGVSGVTWTCSGAAGASCPAPSGSGSIESLSNVALPVNGRLTYTVSIPVPLNSAGGQLDYMVAGSLAIGYTDNNPNNNSSTGSATVNPATDLRLSVSSGAQAQNGTVTHTFTVTNGGPGVAPAQSFTYQLPPGVDLTQVIPGAGWSCAPVSGSLLCTRQGALAAGASAPAISVVVLPPVTATMLTVQGSAQTTDDQLRLLGDLVPANNSVNTTVAVTGPDLALTVTSAPQAIDGSVTHQLQVVNNGPGTAPGESLVYDLMAGAQIKLVFPGLGWDCATSTNPGGGPRVTCTRNSSLPPATLAPPVQIVVQPPLGSATLPLVATTIGLDDQAMPLTNDPAPANNTVTQATQVAAGPDLALKVTTQPQEADGSVTTRLQLSNNGPGTAPGASVMYSLPPGSRIKSVNPGSGWTCTPTTNADTSIDLVCTRTTAVPPGDAPPIEVTVFPPFGADMLKTQAMAMGQDAQGRALIDVNPTNNMVDSSVPVVSGPDLALKVTENKDSIDTSIQYTLQVTNLGEGAAQGAKVVYQIPPGATVLKVEPGAGWSCTTAPSETEQGTVTCLWSGTLPVGDATPIVITVRPPAGATSLPVQAFTDGVDAQGGVLFDPDRSNNTVSESSTVDPVRFSGGGCGCKMPGTTPVPDVALTGLFLVAAAGLLLRRRRRPEEQTI